MIRPGHRHQNEHRRNEHDEAHKDDQARPFFITEDLAAKRTAPA